MAETDGILFCDICNKSIPKSMNFSRVEGKLICADCKSKIAGQNQQAPTVDARAVQTIEKTAKKWKGTQLVGALLGFIGVVEMFMPPFFTDSPYRGWGLMLALAGLAIILVARTFAWWYHG